LVISFSFLLQLEGCPKRLHRFQQAFDNFEKYTLKISDKSRTIKKVELACDDPGFRHAKTLLLRQSNGPPVDAFGFHGSPSLKIKFHAGTVIRQQRRYR